MVKRPLFISIKTKFLAFAALLIITTMMVNSYFAFKYDKKMIREEMEVKARSIAVSLSLEGTEVMLENLYYIQNSLADFSRLPDVSQIAIIDDLNMIRPPMTP